MGIFNILSLLEYITVHQNMSEVHRVSKFQSHSHAYENLSLKIHVLSTPEWLFWWTKEKTTWNGLYSTYGSSYELDHENIWSVFNGNGILEGKNILASMKGKSIKHPGNIYIYWCNFGREIDNWCSIHMKNVCIH